LAFILIILSYISCATPESSVSVGKEGRLYSEGSLDLPVAVSEQALEETVQAFVSKDKYGQAELMIQGKWFPVENNTKVLVIDRSFARRKVRILEGKHKGRAGWVPMEFVKPL